MDTGNGNSGDPGGPDLITAGPVIFRTSLRG